MPEQGSIVCPDCGAAYQCTPEQSGKLLHCKCGRYLVAGGNNHKTPAANSSKTTAEVPKPAPSIAARDIAPIAPKQVKPEVPKAAEEPAQAQEPEPAESKNLVSIAVAVVAILVVGAGFFVLRPMTTAKASKPQVIEATVPAPQQSPAPCSTAPVRLENGTQIAHSMLGSGMGKLEIENAMPTDAVVRITGSANLTVEWVYIQQGQKVSLDNVPLGTHKVMVSSGSDWDTQNLNFKCNDSYAVLEKALDYTDRREDDHTTYSAYHLVLGKQRTAMITKDDFFVGHIDSK